MTERPRYGFDDEGMPWEPDPPEEPDPLPVTRLHEIVWDGDAPYDPRDFEWDEDVCFGWLEEQRESWKRFDDLDDRGTDALPNLVLPLSEVFAYTFVTQEKQRIARRIVALDKLLSMCSEAWEEYMTWESYD